MEVKKVAVITGDLINSRQIPIEKRQQVYDYMAHVYHSFAVRRGWHDTAKLEFFRGDSFQLLVDEPEVALRVALFLRARLRSISGRSAMLCLAINVLPVRLRPFKSMTFPAGLPR